MGRATGLPTPIVARTRTRTRTRVRIRVSDTPRKMMDTGVDMKSRFKGLVGMLTSQAFQICHFRFIGVIKPAWICAKNHINQHSLVTYKLIPVTKVVKTH